MGKSRLSSCCCCFCLLGWKLGAWRRKLGAGIRVRRGTTSSTLISSSSSHRSEGPSPICALNRIRVSKEAARVRQRETEAGDLKSDPTLPQVALFKSVTNYYL